MIKMIKQLIRSLITLLLGVALYYALKRWIYPEAGFIDEVFCAFAFGVIVVTEDYPCRFSFSLYNKPVYSERYSSTVISDAATNVTRLDLPDEDNPFSFSPFRIILPCFSGVDAQYIPLLCENICEKSVSKVTFRLEHLALFSSAGKIIRQQYPIKQKYTIPYINPIEKGDKVLLIFQINLNREAAIELRNGRIILGISSRVNGGVFRRYDLVELQVFEGRCDLLTQQAFSSLLKFRLNRWLKKRKIQTMMEYPKRDGAGV